MNRDKFTDRSAQPIGDELQYVRGDGALVKFSVTPPVQLANSEQKPAPEASCASGECKTEPCTTGKCPPKPGTQHVKAQASIVLPRGVPITINPKARISTDGKKPGTRPGGNTQFIKDDIADHPAFGGRATVFVLFYGNHFDLHKKCLTSIIATIPGSRLDLRVGSNMAEQRTLDMIEEYVKNGFIKKHYYHQGNDYKYPVMREMFNDPTCPIETKWVLWFDDDTICDVDPNWFNTLATHIAQHHKGNEAHMIGATYTWTTNAKQRAIFASRPWYRGRPWRGQDGKPSPNGNKIIFAAGGFWAITLEALRAADIPDLGTGLTHNGGDWQIGEQLYQAGYGLKQFNGSKQFVRTSSVPRRGVTMPTVDQVTSVPAATTATPPPQPRPPVQPPVPKLRVVEL